MSEIKLDEYIKEKGVLKSPWNSFLNLLTDEESWFFGRMPEYLWIGLIIDYYGKKQGTNILLNFMEYLAKFVDDLKVPMWSQICLLPEKKQNIVFEKLFLLIDKNILIPLTVFQCLNLSAINFHYYYESFVRNQINH